MFKYLFLRMKNQKFFMVSGVQRRPVICFGNRVYRSIYKGVLCHALKRFAMVFLFYIYNDIDITLETNGSSMNTSSES